MAKNKRKKIPKRVLKPPDLERSKSAVLNSLTSVSSQLAVDRWRLEAELTSGPLFRSINKAGRIWEMASGSRSFQQPARRVKLISFVGNQCGESERGVSQLCSMMFEEATNDMPQLRLGTAAQKTSTPNCTVAEPIGTVSFTTSTSAEARALQHLFIASN